MSRRVIVIDDDGSVLEDLAYFLASKGYGTRPVSRSSEAYEVVSSPVAEDCVVMDVMMRKPAEAGELPANVETGEYLYKRLRESNPDLPVVIMSAKDQDTIDIDFKKKNVFYSKKPYGERAEDVISIIERAINEKNK